MDDAVGAHNEVAWIHHDRRAVAYQVIGSGPPDVLLLDDWFTHLDLDWDDPYRARWLRRAAASARLIRFDKSGMGLSDRVAPPAGAALETWVEEAIAVLDAVGARTARLLVRGWSGPLGMRLAQRHPERFDRVAFATAFARLRGPGDPVGVDPAVVDAGQQIIMDSWGSGVLTDVLGQSRDRLPEYQHTLDARYERAAVAPRELRSVVDALADADSTGFLAGILADSLVVHRPNPLLPVEHSRWIAERIPNAHLEVVEEVQWEYPVAEDELLADELRALAFLTDSPHERDLQHELVTIVFIDIVGSTPYLHRVGDREWSDALEDFTGSLHLNLAHFKGRLAGSAGDGFFLAFDSPRRAMRFTFAMSARAEALGLPVRAGVHTGECHVHGTELRGLAVHATARIMDRATSGEVFASSVVQQLLIGEEVEFRSVGTHELRGVPGMWDLFKVTTRGADSIQRS